MDESFVKISAGYARNQVSKIREKILAEKEIYRVAQVDKLMEKRFWFRKRYTLTEAESEVEKSLGFILYDWVRLDKLDRISAVLKNYQEKSIEIYLTIKDALLLEQS